MRTPHASPIRILLLLPLILAPVPALAQSILGTQGLGFPLEPMDARARGMGSVGTGLFGGSLTPLDPASSTDLFIPTLNLTLQPFWSDASMGDEALESQGMRFPLVGLAYPVGALNAMVSLTVGGFMDQRWEVTVDGTEELGGETVDVVNLYRSEGGISSLSLGWAQRVSRKLSLSAGLGYHTGSVTRTFVRAFDTISAGTSQIQGFSDGGKWKYGGPTGSLGAVWDPVEFLRLSGSVTWHGALEADPSDQTDGAPASYELPTEYRFGASGLLTPRLSVTVGMSYADWKPSSQGLKAESLVGTVMSWGGGVEWRSRAFGSRTLPLRLGIRKATLPFRLDGDDPTETTYSGGWGLNFTQAEDFVLAGIDMAVEKGTRESGSFSEDFWRGTITFRVSGW